jgi:DNA-binding CsgD family transcriptional regulator
MCHQRCRRYPQQVLVGRDVLCAELDGLLDAARQGDGAALGLLGPAGIGKTSLLEYLATCADGARVLHLNGSPGEMHVPFAGLSQLLTPLLDGLPLLVPAQAAAVESALTVGSPASEAVLGVYMGALNLVTTAAQERPLLVIVDDCHWFDEVSRDALGFVCRRVARDPVVVVMSFRTGEGLPPPPAGVACRTVEGLDASASESLLQQQGHRFSPQLMAWLVQASGGNPLALSDLPHFATSTELAVMALASQPMPVGPRLEAAYSRAFKGLPTEAQRATLIAVVLDDADVRVVERALRSVGLRLDGLAAAEDAGLLKLGAGLVRLRHPLVRSAVTQLVEPILRRAAHQAAAVGLLGSSRLRHREARVWHLAEASVGVDELTAGMLEELAEQAVRQAGYAEATACFEKAAELSEGEHRGRRLLAAANAAFNAGQSVRCRELLQDAVEESRADAPTSTMIHLQAQLDTWSTDPEAAARQLQAQVMQIGALDPILSIKLAVDATAAAALSGQLRLASELAETVGVITRAAGPAAEPAGDLLVGSVQAMRGDGVDALPALDRCRRALQAGDASPDLPQQLVYLATSYHFIDGFDEALPLFEQAITLGRAYGAIAILPFAFAHQASTRYRIGDWDGASSDAFQALTLAADSGRLLDRPIALIMLGMVEAAQGASAARERAREAIEVGESLGARFVVAQGLSILGLLELSSGRPAAAVPPLRACGTMAVELGLMELGYLQWAADLVEALTQSGAGSALPTLAIIEGATHPGTTTIDRALLARSRALAAVDETWDGHFQDALHLHELAPTRPFERARTQLYFAERLRRSRRRKQARPLLSSAWETFDRLRARPWAERAARELAATGATASNHVTRRSDLLTPQELQVAKAAAAGATNRQIADSLFLSQKTVEFHLSAIYRRLELTRADLEQLLANGP